MEKPTYTQINNNFIKNMNLYTGSEVKIFLAISRKTIGWHKETDKISYSQLCKMTGLSRRILKLSIEKLVNDKWIMQSGNSKSGYCYDLNFSNAIEKTAIAETATELGQKLPQNDAKLGQKLPPQKKVKIKKKETKIKYRSNVFLTEKEHDKLLNEYGESQVEEMFDKISNYKGSVDKKYKSDYRAILLWVVESTGVEPIKNNYGMCEAEKKFFEKQRGQNAAS